VYLDTAILVKLLVREPDSRLYAELVEGEVVWSSQIVVTECFSALLRKERERGITPLTAAGPGGRSRPTSRLGD